MDNQSCPQIFVASWPSRRARVAVWRYSRHAAKTRPLEIRLSGTNVVLSWPSLAANALLETTGDLTTTNPWATVTNLPALENSQYVVTNQVAGGNRFYKLSR